MNHCEGCEMKGGCRQDGKCRRPATGLDYALREAQAAIEALTAASKRLNEAMGNLAAAMVIDKTKGPL